MEIHDRYNVLHSWAWRRLPEKITGTFSYARAEVIGDMPIKYEKLPCAIDQTELSSIQAYMESISLKQMGEMLYKMFTINMDSLFSEFDYDSDGSVALDEDIINTVASANGVFSNVVTAGKRLTDKLEELLSNAYGRDSGELSDWNGLRRRIYDESFSYALCYELRNVYQHEFLVVNLVGIDMTKRRGWLVLNFDHEILEKSLKADIKTRAEKFIDSRKENGQLGRINIFLAASEFYTHLTTLYLKYMELIAVKILDDAVGAEAALANKQGVNCMLYEPNDAIANQDKVDVYWIYDASVEQCKMELDSLHSEIGRFHREFAEAIFDAQTQRLYDTCS